MDFDRAIARDPYSSTKWNKYRGRDVIPLWVADMDFASPPSVLEALHRRVDHGILGYTDAPDSLVDAVQRYAERHYRWTIEADWLVWLPGLVPGLNLACRAVGQEGDTVLTATPVYPPFLHAPAQSARKLQTVPLVETAEGWRWNFDALEDAVSARTRLLLLCHPHNPVGRAWQPEELAVLIDVAERHGLIVCSDEIHCDLLLDPTLRHTPLACVAPAFADRTITLMAPSKTWNLPGLGCSFAVIPDRSLRRRFRDAMAGLVPHVNTLGFTAAEAAYRDDGTWLAALLVYLRGNLDLFLDWLAGASHLKASAPEATYLAWIDARAVDPTNPLPHFEALGVGPSDGRDFGFPGYVRLNFACRRALLQQALERLAPLR